MFGEPGIAQSCQTSIDLFFCSLLNRLGVNVLFSLSEQPLISASDKRNDALLAVVIAYIAGNVFQQDGGKLS